MAQKVIDIFPPKKIKEHHPSPFKEEIRREGKPISLKGKKGNFLKKGLVFLSIFFIFIFIVFHFFLARAEIKIWPKTETFNTDEKITVDGKSDQLDLLSKVIPGKVFDVEKTISEEFSSTGKLSKKAEGVIRLYNAYSAQSEIWQTGTRFVSNEGKLFLAKNKINVPGAQIKDGKITPSFVDVPVVAAQGGSDYNIGPSNFSIFIYRGTPRYTKFYGESFKAMKGGGETYQVTKEDLEKAENILLEKAKIEAEAALKNKIPEGFTFSDKAVETKILEKSSSVEAGTESEKFNFQVKAKSTTISFKTKDIEDFALLFIAPQVPEGKKFYRESLRIEYLSETLNLESERAILSLKISGKIYPEVDLNSLRKALTAKSLTEAGALLENQTEITHYEIKLSPPWLKRIPDKLEKIKIELRIGVGVD